MGSIFVKYLVCYDISDSRKRRQFFEDLKDLGLIPVQKSVFYGDLKPPEVKMLSQMIKNKLDPEEDSCLWFPCHLTVDRIQSCLGLHNFSYNPPDGNGII